MGHRLTAEKYLHHLKRHKLSGISIKSYCEKHDLNYHTFSYYRQKAKVSKKSIASPPSSAFVPAKVVPSSSVVSSASLSKPLSIKSIDPVWLADFVRTVLGVR